MRLHLLTSVDLSHLALWKFDAVGVLLAVATLVIGAFVCKYALRQFEGEQRSWQFQAISIAILAALVSTDLANSPKVLCSSWVATSLLTLALLFRFDAKGWRGVSGRQAALTFLVVDLLLVIGFASAFWFPTHHIWLLVVGAEIAAVGRAGLTLRRSWVIETVNAPTPVSALLHAGVVNSGALLLFRVNHWSGRYTIASYALAAVCIVVLFSLAPRINARVDLKGQLAVSTVSQMTFMLLAISIGWPLLAFTHLIGHGFYKAVRFMGSGGATAQRARSRRRVRAGKRITIALRLFGSAVLAVVGVLLGFTLGNEARAVTAVFTLAAISMWWTKSAGPMRSSIQVWSIFAGGLVGYALIVRGLVALLGKSIYWNGFQAPWWGLGFAVLVLAGTTRFIERRSTIKLAGVKR